MFRKLTGNQKPKSAAARPKSPIKPGAFWLSAFKSKATASKSKASTLNAHDSDSEDQAEDQDSIEMSTTISTINIDEINILDDNDAEEDEADIVKKDESSTTKLPIPERQQATVTLANSVKAWASPLKVMSPSPPQIPSTAPLPKALFSTGEDENSTEFEIHVADSSLLVHSPSDPNLNRSESPTLTSNNFDFLPKRSQIPRSPFRPKAPQLPMVEEKRMRIIELPPVKQAPFTESVAIPSTTITTTTEPPRYHDNNIDQFKADPQDQLDEYEARIEFAKQESRTYIFNLRQQLSLAESRIASLESENEELHAFRLDAESREDHIHGRFSELVVELDRLQSYCYEQEETEKAMMSENEQLRKAVEEMANDLELVSARLEHEKKQSFKQEADFELFSKKIKSQQLLIAELQEEKDRMQSSLRKAQYDPPTQPTELILQDQLEKALFDIESLKLVIQDLTSENSLLRDPKQPTTSTLSQPLRTANPQQSPSKSSIRDTSSTWALPSDKDRSAFLKRMRQYEQEADLEQDESTSLSFQSTRLPLTSPLPSTSASTSTQRRLPSQSLREFVKQSQPQPPPQQPDQSSTVAEYYRRKESLESRLGTLESEKKKLTFELSRVPSTGVMALKRQNELEALLDVIDSEMASTRRQMKDFGLF